MDNRNTSRGVAKDDMKCRSGEPLIEDSHRANLVKKHMSPDDTPILVEVICERYHCVMYDYAINTVELVAEDYEDRVEIKPVVRRGDRRNAERYLELCRVNGRHLSVPTILIDGEVAFTDVPTPAELRTALDRALASR